MTHPNRAYTRTQLLDRIWGNNAYLEDHTIDVHIRRLRKILEPHNLQHYIQTVRGIGYRFSEKITKNEKSIDKKNKKTIITKHNRITNKLKNILKKILTNKNPVIEYKTYQIMLNDNIITK